MSRNRSRNVVLAFFVLLAFALVSHAQAPTSRVIHYENVQTDVLSTPGQPFRLQLFDIPTGGTPRYCEDQALDTDATGLISFDFGAGTPSTPPCPSSPPGLNPNDFTSGESRYLDVADPSTGASHLTARVPVKAVGFAVNPGPQGPQGIQGLPGQQGPPGVVQTVSPGDASITVSGTAADRLVSITPNGVTNANVANGALSAAKITGTAATLGSNVFNGGQTIIGDIAPVHVLSGSDIIVGDVPNRAFPDSRSVYIENSAGDPRNNFRLDGFFDHLVIVGDSAPGALAGAALQFRTAPAGGGELPRMEIAPNGNVGIGTSAPVFKLDVVGDIKASGKFMGDGSGLSNLSGSQFVDGGINREQVALLKWFAANQTASFPVGANPFGVAFDGASIWVTNFGSNTVSKLRASDGAPQPGSPFPVGTAPIGVAFDGANIWVANSKSNTVSKLRASDGTLFGTFPVGTAPYGVAFDGANIWVTNSTSSPGTVSKLRASDGTLLGTFPVGDIFPIGVAFDGANIWVTNSNNVSKLRASDGAPLGNFPAGLGPWGVAFDGVNIWVTNSGEGTVSKLRASDGAPQGASFRVGTRPLGVAFDGANIWVTNVNSNTVSKLRASDGTLLGTFTLSNSPGWLAFDGANIWVANSNSGIVSKL